MQKRSSFHTCDWDFPDGYLGSFRGFDRFVRGIIARFFPQFAFEFFTRGTPIDSDVIAGQSTGFQWDLSQVYEIIVMWPIIQRARMLLYMVREINKKKHETHFDQWLLRLQIYRRDVSLRKRVKIIL